MIFIQKAYSWYNVLVNNVVILRKLSEADKNDIEKALIEQNVPYRKNY
jgi:hypothetical protein